MEKLTQEKLEAIVSRRICSNKIPTGDESAKEEVLSCLYFRLSKIADKYEYIGHDNLVATCDKVFESFELDVPYDKELHTDDPAKKFSYIVKCLYALKKIKIQSRGLGY